MKTGYLVCTLLFIASAAGAEPGAAPPPAPTLTEPRGATSRTDTRGFIHRWLVLEPVPVPGRLTETAVNEALKSAPLSEALPRAGDELTLSNSLVKWHALDTLNYNV